MNDHHKPHRSPPHEDAVTAHARLKAATLAARLDACARTDEFLRGDAGDSAADDADLQLSRTADGIRTVIIEPGTPQERSFRKVDALRNYVRQELVLSFTVRREGWTVPDPRRPRIEPDTARLLLHAGHPVIDVVAAIAMDGTLHEPRLRHNDAANEMVDADDNEQKRQHPGIGYLATLFKVTIDRT